MGEMLWFCFCVCVTLYTVSVGAPTWVIVLNVIVDVSALLRTIRAMTD